MRRADPQALEERAWILPGEACPEPLRSSHVCLIDGERVFSDRRGVMAQFALLPVMWVPLLLTWWYASGCGSEKNPGPDRDPRVPVAFDCQHRKDRPSIALPNATRPFSSDDQRSDDDQCC